MDYDMNTNGLFNMNFTKPIPIRPLKITFEGSHPFREIEKGNVKIRQYILYGFNASNLKVRKEFKNKTSEIFLIIQGEAETLFGKDYIDEKIHVDTNIYDAVDWEINDGILTITMYEIINPEPELELNDRNK